MKSDCYCIRISSRKHGWSAIHTLVSWGVFPVIAVGQINNAGSPIVFNAGNTIDTATIIAGAHSGFSTPDISNPVQILGTGGSLVGSSSLSFLSAFAGPGNLTLNLENLTSIKMGYTYYPSSSIATFSNGFTMQSGEIDFHYGTSIVNGDFSVTGNSNLRGNVVFTGNKVTGIAGKTLNGGATFAGAGPEFIFNSDIGSVISRRS